MVEATNGAGGVGSASVRVSVQPPVMTLVTPPSGSLLETRIVTLSGTCGSATEVTVDGAPATVTGGAWELADYDLGEDGLKTLTITGTSCGGPASITVVLDLDTLPPSLSIDSPHPDTLVGASPVTVSGPVEDAHLASVTVNGLPATVDGERFTVDVPLTEGTNTLTATATDAFGRTTTSQSVAVTLDTEAPSVTITIPSSGEVFETQTVTVEGDASDPHLLRVTVNGVPATLDGGHFTATGVPLVEGDNELIATALDTLGHRSQSPSVVVVLDTLPPQVAIDPGSFDALTEQPAVTVSGSVTDPHLATVTVNGVPATVVDGTFVAEGVPLAEGDTQLVATATDTLGHAAQSDAVTVTRDSLPPSVAITEPAPGAELGEAAVTVRGTVTDPHLDRVTVGAVLAVVTGDTFEAAGVELPEGESDLVARAVDTLGHGADSEPVPVDVDTLPPVVEIDTPADGAVLSDPTVTVSGPHLRAAPGLDQRQRPPCDRCRRALHSRRRPALRGGEHPHRHRHRQLRPHHHLERHRHPLDPAAGRERRRPGGRSRRVPAGRSAGHRVRHPAEPLRHPPRRHPRARRL